MADNDDAANVLPALNGRLQFRIAYNYRTSQEILAFIDTVANSRDPGGEYGIVEEWRGNHLRNIRDGIRSLYLNGPGYEAPDPPQHIRRTENTSRNARCPLNVENYVFPRRHRIFSVYDLLAIFLSLAPAPIGATRATFYYPWTVVFIRWSTIMTAFGGDYRVGGKVPTMYQCTWRTEPGRQSRFFIGTVLAGMVTVGRPSGANRNPWVRTLRRARFAHLTHNGQENGQVVGARRWAYGQSPKFDDTPEAGWNFGNCAETHPFVELVQDADPVGRSRCYGFAVRPSEVFGGQPLANLEAMLAMEYCKLKFTNMALPCLNCKEMINEVYHCRYFNFVPLPDHLIALFIAQPV
ncbi:hypothetical protein ETB97_007814 [Aspergillus alliaceus]|uniref:Uncharacterized protein n=1 Tax=Petromyces alliaceus TaxID=209559 RepID=A0A8H6E1R5_PETAA|nr:hypothetical protein ETB97_007814 [Aspergillus burnettii]